MHLSEYALQSAIMRRLHILAACQEKLRQARSIEETINLELLAVVPDGWLRLWVRDEEIIERIIDYGSYELKLHQDQADMSSAPRDLRKLATAWKNQVNVNIGRDEGGMRRIRFTPVPSP